MRHKNPTEVFMSNKLLFIFSFLILLSCVKQKNECLKTRAALDIGSGSTKVKIAKVDMCKKMIVENLFQEEIPISFKEDLLSKKSGKDNMFSDEIQAFGFQEIKKLSEKIKKFSPDEIFGVGTSAFRTANNAIYFFSKIKSEIGIPVEIIDQSKEAELGLYSAATATGKKLEEMIVWDIGGASMQITTIQNGKVETYLGEMGAISFKDQVISRIKKKNLSTIRSPNPLGVKNFIKAVKLAKEEASNKVSSQFKDLIKKPINVYGIGGVHSYSVYSQVEGKDNFYTFEQLQNIFPKRVTLTDEQVGGNYADTEITNLALVLGYMEALEISKVIIYNINLTEGILVYPEIIAK
ncbi:MAG: hypothetical protein A2381_08615 [Bdellovibrionales bacterium RIFOXYB1_FULL_37_110]|nr:MAG: hypothetical protein A2181_08810 [Bdellovibrionales bacterium RIFOXYA1_FULL_38_20]OFZ60905.1 MAG: hypothetical protein A2381_08615 [Bdellovibrionales bacterium RIFOXYB1_FULL_37_110]OFZ63649.1 MAG: hypothetical protein A2577_07735 [Bdellovibrionales bacterium RIFOXYD1_FULL_36_51]